MLWLQEDCDDEDEWNPCKAAGVCLSLMSGCCEDTILPSIVPFVLEHIRNTDWKYRDAAVMALGRARGQGVWLETWDGGWMGC